MRATSYPRLVGLVRERGMTLLEFADKIGISESTLHAKLRGESDFKQSEIRAACSVLGIPEAEIPAYFFAA